MNVVISLKMLNFLAFDTSHKSCFLFFVFGVPNAKILAFETPFASALLAHSPVQEIVAI